MEVGLLNVHVPVTMEQEAALIPPGQGSAGVLRRLGQEVNGLPNQRPGWVPARPPHNGVLEDFSCNRRGTLTLAREPRVSSCLHVCPPLCPRKKVTGALSSACSHTHPPTYSESCDRTSRVACSSPQTRLPTGPRAGEPAAVESRAGPVAQHQRTGLTVSSLGSQTSSGGNLGSAL